MSEENNIDYFGTFLGKYVSTFQYIKGKLDQILQLAIGQERFHVSHSILTKLSNRDKIDVIQSIVSSSKIASKNTEWINNFNRLINRLREEGSRRNKILHSQIIFYFVEIGAPPLRSKGKTTKKGFSFDQEYLDQSSTDSILKEIATLSLDIGFAYKQFVHWHDDLNTSENA